MVNVKIIERTEIEREDDSGADDEQHERDGEHDIENDRQRGFLKFIRHGNTSEFFILQRQTRTVLSAETCPPGWVFLIFLWRQTSYGVPPFLNL